MPQYNLAYIVCSVWRPNFNVNITVHVIQSTVCSTEICITVLMDLMQLMRRICLNTYLCHEAERSLGWLFVCSNCLACVTDSASSIKHGILPLLLNHFIPLHLFSINSGGGGSLQYKHSFKGVDWLFFFCRLNVHMVDLWGVTRDHSNSKATNCGLNTREAATLMISHDNNVFFCTALYKTITCSIV